MRIAWSTAHFAALLLLPTWPASAYELLLASDSLVPCHWETPAVGYAIADNPQELAADEVRDAARRAADSWESIGCHTLRLIDQGFTASQTEAIDGHNRVLFLHSTWPGSPAEVALTRVTRSKSTGRIADSDILINDGGYHFSLAETPPDGEIQLEAVLAHEFGHFLGLDHSEVPGATMQAQIAGEHTPLLGSLESDDRLGLCALYEPQPLAQTHTQRAPPAGPLDPVTPQPSPVSPWRYGWLAVLLLVPLRRVLAVPPSYLLLSIVALPLCCDNGPRDGGFDTHQWPTSAAPLDDVHTPDGESGDDGQMGSDSADIGDGERRHEAADTFTGEQLSDLLLRLPSWRVIRIEAQDQIVAGDRTEVVPADLDSWQLSFLRDGSLLDVRTTAGGKRINDDCAHTASWAVRDNRLEWSWWSTPHYCPGERPLRHETLRATYSNELGELHLALDTAQWSIGTSGQRVRPYTLVLEPLDAMAPIGSCEPLPGLERCALECSPEGHSGPPTAHALSCAPMASSAKCETAVDSATGEWLEQSCTQGCYETFCRVTPGAGVTCEVPSLGLSCESEE